jgi:hypothetical protein
MGKRITKIRHNTIREHCEAMHPRAKHLDFVRNLSGTAYMCCVGDCDWSVGLRKRGT